MKENVPDAVQYQRSMNEECGNDEKENFSHIGDDSVIGEHGSNVDGLRRAVCNRLRKQCGSQVQSRNVR